MKRSTQVVSYVMRFKQSTKPYNAVSAVAEDLKQRGHTVGIASLELIRHGDPDGQGELQRTNEFAIRYTVT